MSLDRLPDPRPNPYRHEPPRRPERLPRRTTPPPERRAPPDLSLFMYVGIALAALLAALATPYVIGYVVEALGR
jgi:hypothetical protein